MCFSFIACFFSAGWRKEWLFPTKVTPKYLSHPPLKKVILFVRSNEKETSFQTWRCQPSSACAWLIAMNPRWARPVLGVVWCSLSCVGSRRLPGREQVHSSRCAFIYCPALVSSCYKNREPRKGLYNEIWAEGQTHYHVTALKLLCWQLKYI